VLEGFLDWLATRPAALQYVLLMLLSATENVLPPVPADTAVVLGAFLARRGPTSVVAMGVLCWLANLGSAAGMYFVARAHARSFLASRWTRRFMPREAMLAIQEAYDRHGALGIFLSRFLPGFRAAVTPFAGVVGLPPGRVLVPAALASAIWYAVLVTIGWAVAANWEVAKELLGDLNRVLALLALVAAVALGVWLWRRTRRAG